MICIIVHWCKYLHHHIPHKSVCGISSLALFHVSIIDHAINILKRTFRGRPEFTPGAWNLFGGCSSSSKLISIAIYGISLNVMLGSVNSHARRIRVTRKAGLLMWDGRNVGIYCEMMAALKPSKSTAFLAGRDGYSSRSHCTVRGKSECLGDHIIFWPLSKCANWLVNSHFRMR